MVKTCQNRNHSIHECDLGGNPDFFACFEHTGQGADANMKRVVADPEPHLYGKATDHCQFPLPDAAMKGKIESDVKEVYFLP